MNPTVINAAHVSLNSKGPSTRTDPAPGLAGGLKPSKNPCVWTTFHRVAPTAGPGARKSVPAKGLPYARIRPGVWPQAWPKAWPRVRPRARLVSMSSPQTHTTLGTRPGLSMRMTQYYCVKNKHISIDKHRITLVFGINLVVNLALNANLMSKKQKIINYRLFFYATPSRPRPAGKIYGGPTTRTDLTPGLGAGLARGLKPLKNPCVWTTFHGVARPAARKSVTARYFTGGPGSRGSGIEKNRR